MEYTNDAPVFSEEKLVEMEERRIDKLNQAGISEGDVLDAANQDFHNWNAYFNENIVRGKADVDFCFRDQWNVVERNEFMRLSKPALIFNKLYDSVKKVIGENRKNKPDLIVRSLTGKASQEELNLRADLLRTIAYQSQNDLVYQTAFKSALTLGFGAFQIGVDYESPRSFKKVIRYHLITDPTTCSWDPTALKPHKGDGNFCSRSLVMTQEEFWATYPYVNNPESWIDPFMLLDYQANTRNLIVLQDNYKKEWYPLVICKLSNDMEVTKDEWEDMQKQAGQVKELARESIVVGNIILDQLPKLVEERQTQDYNIMHYRMLRNQIVDFARWKSRHLPIPFCDGDSFYIEGRQYTKSFVHEAKDAQKTLNYYKSEIAAEIKNRRREQWVGTPDNIKGYEQFWRNPESQTGIMLAQPDPKSGMLPKKSPAWEISQGLLQNAQAAHQDIQEILGFSENESLQGRDVSGKARRERKMEGAMSAYVFYDNLNQAVEQGGRIVNDLLNYIIGDEERGMSLSKKDGKSENVIINKRNSAGKIENQLSDGEFDVEIDTGPSFAVQKDIALEFFQQTIAANPQTFPLIADLWAKNLDVQFMPQIAERFKSMVPPEILAKEEGKPPPPPKPDPQQQMMQMEMQEKMASIQEKAKKLQLDGQKLELEKQKLALDEKEMLQKMQIETAKNHTEIVRADLDYHAEMARSLADLHKHGNEIHHKEREMHHKANENKKSE